MKQYRITFETAKLDTFDLCQLVSEAQQNGCDIQFSSMYVLMHIDTDDKFQYYRFQAWKDITASKRKAA